MTFHYQFSLSWQFLWSKSNKSGLKLIKEIAICWNVQM